DVERVGRRTEDGGQPEQKTENRKQSAQLTFFRSADILVRFGHPMFIRARKNQRKGAGIHHSSFIINRLSRIPPGLRSGTAEGGCLPRFISLLKNFLHLRRI